MKIKDLKKYAETKTKTEVFSLSDFLSGASASTRNKRQSKILDSKAGRLLEYSEKRFGKNWWK